MKYWKMKGKEKKKWPFKDNTSETIGKIVFVKW